MKYQIQNNRLKRKIRIRKKIFGSQDRPRLVIFRSNKNIYAQIIDDERGHTLASANIKTISSDISPKLSIENAKKVGIRIAEIAMRVNVSKVVFDRNGYIYHGRVKALADGAREAGLQF